MSAKKAFIARQPIGRIGKPEEIAELALYLATATYTTGQVHVIDGGWTRSAIASAPGVIGPSWCRVFSADN